MISLTHKPSPSTRPRFHKPHDSLLPTASNYKSNNYNSKSRPSEFSSLLIYVPLCFCLFSFFLCYTFISYSSSSLPHHHPPSSLSVLSSPLNSSTSHSNQLFHTALRRSLHQLEREVNPALLLHAKKRAREYEWTIATEALKQEEEAGRDSPTNPILVSAHYLLHRLEESDYASPSLLPSFTYVAGLPFSSSSVSARELLLSALLMDEGPQLRAALLICAGMQGRKEEGESGEERGRIYLEFPGREVEWKAKHTQEELERAEKGDEEGDRNEKEGEGGGISRSRHLSVHLNTMFNGCDTTQLFLLAAHRYLQFVAPKLQKRRAERYEEARLTGNPFTLIPPVDAVGDQLFLQSLAPAISMALAYLYRHLDSRFLFSSFPPSSFPSYALHSTYWKSSSLSSRSDGSPSYPVVYTVVQAQTIAAFRAVIEMKEMMEEKKIDFEWKIELGFVEGEEKGLRKVVKEMVRAMNQWLWKDLKRERSGIWEWAEEQEEEGYFVIGLDRDGVIGGLSSDTLHLLAYLQCSDVSSSRLQALTRSTRPLLTSIGYRIQTFQSRNEFESSPDFLSSSYSMNSERERTVFDFSLPSLFIRSFPDPLLDDNVYLWEQYVIWRGAKREGCSLKEVENGSERMMKTIALHVLADEGEEMHPELTPNENKAEESQLQAGENGTNSSSSSSESDLPDPDSDPDPAPSSDSIRQSHMLFPEYFLPTRSTVLFSSPPSHLLHSVDKVWESANDGNHLQLWSVAAMAAWFRDQTRNHPNLHQTTGQSSTSTS